MKHLLYLLGFLFSANTVFGTTQQAYVCDQLGNSVTIIDVSNDTTQTIYGFTHPRVVHVNPDGTHAFVGSDDNTVRVIDTITSTLQPVVIDVTHPVAMAVSPNADFLYVASNNETVSVIETSTYTVKTVITGFSNLQDIKVTPDGAYVYATNAGNGTVSIIQTSDNTIVDTITGFQKPVGITLTVDGTYAYITETSTNSVYFVDTSSNTITDIILGFDLPAYAAASPNKDFIFVSNTGNNTISIIRTSDNFVINTLAIPSPKSIAITQDGNYLYIGSDLETVYKVDLISYDILTVIPGFQNPSNIALTTNNIPGNTVNGCQVVDSPTNIYNIVSWSAGPGTPVSYKLYRDAALSLYITTVPPTTLQYIDKNRVLGQSYSYFVLADYANGFSSTIGSVEVTPVRLCQNL
jgi:YVTN family beta-propeller protein